MCRCKTLITSATYDTFRQLSLSHFYGNMQLIYPWSRWNVLINESSCAGFWLLIFLVSSCISSNIFIHMHGHPSCSLAWLLWAMLITTGKCCDWRGLCIFFFRLIIKKNVFFILLIWSMSVSVEHQKKMWTFLVICIL